jgi:mono/diheme cytochrome c family protein
MWFPQIMMQRILLTLITTCLAISLSGCLQKAGVKKPSLASAPVVDNVASKLDFGYPSKPPSLKEGKEVFAQSCAQCHAPSFFQQASTQKTLTYSTPIDLFILLTTGEAPVLKEENAFHKNIDLENHPAFADTLSRDERWAAIFYARHLAGASDITHKATSDDPDIAAVYGGNCAVCHGKKGNANGNLHTGHPSNHELEGGKVHGGLFYPAPARFTQYDRVFNRTDAQWYTYLVEGIYPSGMPAWLGNVDKDKGYVYDETLLWMLVKHLRSLAITNDLPEDSINPTGLMGPAPNTKALIPPVDASKSFDYKGNGGAEYFSEQTSNMPLLKRKEN